MQRAGCVYVDCIGYINCCCCITISLLTYCDRSLGSVTCSHQFRLPRLLLQKYLRDALDIFGAEF